MAAYYGETSDAAREVASQTKYNPMGGAMLGTIADAPERDLRHIITRINEAIGSAGLCAERIHEIADRVKGSVPANDPKAGFPSAGAGDIAEIHSLLDTLFNNLSRTGDGIGRLERL